MDAEIDQDPSGVDGGAGHLDLAVRLYVGAAGVSFGAPFPGTRKAAPFVTTKPRGEGTGLGLSIVDSLLREVGGRIVWESEPGRTVFSVFLAESPGDPEA